MADLEVHTEQFRAAGQKLLALDDRKLVLATRKEIRTAAKPAGDRMLSAIADVMPKRGGLADLIRTKGRISILVDMRRGVRIQLANRTGVFMGPFESGTIRHPVFGNRKTWRAQSVPGGRGTEQFEKEVEALQPQIVTAVEKAVRGAL